METPASFATSFKVAKMTAPFLKKPDTRNMLYILPYSIICLHLKQASKRLEKYFGKRVDLFEGAGIMKITERRQKTNGEEKRNETIRAGHQGEKRTAGEI